jgi:uncharacterized protein
MNFGADISGKWEGKRYASFADGAHPIPDAALDGDIAILGRKGGGKTYTSKGIVERLLDLGRRVLVLDPLGVWKGLRTASDGERPGYAIAVFGGESGDLPLDPAAADPLARIIAKENLPAVLDLSELSKTKQQAFLSVFLHELRRVNTEALTIVLEEADVFAPQNPMGDDSKLLHSEIDWIARRGRFKGFRLISITQRPARLSKDVLTQCSTLIAHRLPSPQDRDAVKAWVDGNGDRDKAKEVFDTLAGLAVGEAWVWSPENDILGRMKFPLIKTMDTSATPKAGEKRVEAKTLAQVDVSGIRAALAAAVKPEAVGKGKSAPSAEVLAEAETRGYEHGHSVGRTDGWWQAIAHVQSMLHSIGRPDAPTESLNIAAQKTTEHRSVARRRSDRGQTIGPVHEVQWREEIVGNGSLNSAAKKLFAVLDTNPPVRRTWTQAATLAGLKARGGHFNTGKKALLAGNFVKETDGLVFVTSASASAPAPSSDPAALVELWAVSLGGAAARILRQLFYMSGEAELSAIAEMLSMKPQGGHWNSGVKTLRDNDIIIQTGRKVRLTELFRSEAHG